MYRFLITATILVLLGFVYLGHRLIVTSLPIPARVALWSLLGAMIANLLWLPFRRWRRQTGAKPASALTRYLENSAYNLMGFLSLLLLFSALSEFIRAVCRVIPADWLATIAKNLPHPFDLDSALATLIAALSIVYFIWGRLAVVRGPRYRRVRLVYPLHAKARRRPRFKKQKSATAKIILAQISDLHIGRAIKKPYVAKVVEKLNAAKVDLVCFTGDIGDGPAASLARDAQALATIEAPHGVYYVPGNHEYYWGLQTWLAVFKKLKFHILENRGETVRIRGMPIFIGGVSDPTAARFAEALPQIPAREKSVLAILLAHQPIFAKSALKYNYDLMLSGHTHGGQYIPWSWIVRLVYRFARGLYRIKNMLVYVNDGTGYWGAPVRIGTRLEITIFDIELRHLE